MLAAQPDIKTPSTLFRGKGLKYLDPAGMLESYPIENDENLHKLNDIVCWMLEHGHSFVDACYEVRVPVLAVCVWADQYPEVANALKSAFNVRNIYLIDKISRLRKDTEERLNGFPGPDVKGIDVVLRMIQLEIENRPTISMDLSATKEGGKPFNVVLNLAEAAD